jgi:hypothetical protein
MAKEIKLETWNRNRPAEAWVDNDGDVGIIDHAGYSIILSPTGAVQLHDWLTRLLSERSNQPREVKGE